MMIVRENVRRPIDKLPEREWRSVECLIDPLDASAAWEDGERPTPSELAIAADAAAARRAASRRRGAR